MSCLSVTITNLEGSLNTEITNINSPFNFEVTKLKGIIVDVNKFSTSPSFNITDIFESKHLKLRCGVVCSVGDVHYLRVSPHEVQWITPDEAIIYMVESDTNWTIITS